MSEKGQVAIPKALRVRLGLSLRTILASETDGGALVWRKKLAADVLARWKGRGWLPGGLTVDEHLRRSRG